MHGESETGILDVKLFKDLSWCVSILSETLAYFRTSELISCTESDLDVTDTERLEKGIADPTDPRLAALCGTLNDLM